MKYKVVITRSAQKDIKKLDPLVKQRLQKKITHFMDSPDPLTLTAPLVASDLGSYRWRVGVFRIIFDIDGDTIVILRIRHRRDVYK